MQDDEAYLLDGEEVVITPHMNVSCDGGNGTLGHPVEFMSLEVSGEAVCKYCDRRYIHKSHARAAEVREHGRRFAA